MKQWNWQKKIFLKSLFILFLFFNNVNAEIFLTGFAKVSDADTIKISEYKIRLHGIDAPEKKTNLPKTLSKFRFFFFI